MRLLFVTDVCGGPGSDASGWDGNRKLLVASWQRWTPGRRCSPRLGGLLERLRWVWSCASRGCTPSGANTAVNYHRQGPQAGPTQWLIMCISGRGARGPLFVIAVVVCRDTSSRIQLVLAGKVPGWGKTGGRGQLDRFDSSDVSFDSCRLSVGSAVVGELKEFSWRQVWTGLLCQLTVSLVNVIRRMGLSKNSTIQSNIL